MSEDTESLEDFVTATGGAALVGLSRQRFYKLASTAGFPDSVRVGGLRLFKRSDLLAWKKNRAVKRKAPSPR